MNEETLKENFRTYIETIVNTTFGFMPTMNVVIPNANTIQIWLEGNEEERAILMGKEGKTISALTRLALVFARRNSCYIYLYVKPKEPEIKW